MLYILPKLAKQRDYGKFIRANITWALKLQANKKKIQQSKTMGTNLGFCGGRFTENYFQLIPLIFFQVDKYRWDLYSGIASPDELNCHWVKLVADIQGT